MIEAFLRHRCLLKELNKTHITFILKKENPIKVNDFRYINLCNVSYKFISKLLANRLWEYLLKMFSSLHSAFVPGKDIHDIILIAHEVFSHFHRNRKKFGYITSKLDKEKTYDCLDWDFMIKHLQDLGFSNQSVKWI